VTSTGSSRHFCTGMPNRRRNNNPVSRILLKSSFGCTVPGAGNGIGDAASAGRPGPCVSEIPRAVTQGRKRP
jgi:hypothetical protein